MSAQAPLRSLPRIFLPGADLTGPIELPAAELDKLRKVLRLSTGDEVAILPDDGSLWRCRLEGRSAVPESQVFPETEPTIDLTIAQALPKTDRLETALRMGTEIGVARFLLFPSERSVVRWEASKLESKLVRLRTIVREAAEQSFRSRLPRIEVAGGLAETLDAEPEAIVLSETEDRMANLYEMALERLAKGSRRLVLMIGPEGGWAPRELERIGSRGVTLGPLVLRTDTAGPVSAAVVLMGAYAAFCKYSPSK